MKYAETQQDRIALIKEIAERRKKMQTLRSRKTVTAIQKPKREFMQVPKEGENVYAWTDAPKYAKEYYGETLYYTTRFDNDWD